MGLVSKGNCVIVGRGADYTLRGSKDAFHVFIHANIDHRVRRTQLHDGVEGQEKRLRREIEVKDHSRAMFYKYFSGREWGMAGNYNFMVDSSVFTKEQCVELIAKAFEMYRGGQNA